MVSLGSLLLLLRSKALVIINGRDLVVEGLGVVKLRVEEMEMGVKSEGLRLWRGLGFRVLRNGTERGIVAIFVYGRDKVVIRTQRYGLFGVLDLYDVV